MNRHRIITHLPDANMIVGAAIAFTAPDVNNSIHRPHEGVQCGDLEYSRAMDFKDWANKTVEYTWDANVNMTSDLNKGKYIGTIPSMKRTKKTK